MLRISSKFASSSFVARTVSAALGLFLLSSLTLPTGCGAFGLTYSLTGLTIEPAYGDTCVYPGATAQYHAYGTYTEGGHASETKDLTDTVAWSVTFPTFASINSSGLLTAGTSALGTSNVVATTEGEFGLLHATSNIQIASPCGSTSSMVPALNVVPAVSTLKTVGDIERPLVIATRTAEPRATDVTARVTWASDNPAVATVDSTGRIAAVGPGKATITATQKLSDGSTITATQAVAVQGGSQNQ